MALFNVGQLWEESEVSDEYVSWELSQLLELDQGQMRKIQAINVAFDSKKEKIYADKRCADELKPSMERLIAERTKQIMEVLNEKQQEVFYAYCTDLLSMNSSF